MDVNETFNCKLNYGETEEYKSLKILQGKLPDYKVFRTNQEPGHPDRNTYKTADIVVAKTSANCNSKATFEGSNGGVNGGSNEGVNEVSSTFFCVECKLNTQFYKKCHIHNSWSGVNNVVINTESLRRYVQADFTIYILSHQKFEEVGCDHYRFWPISKIIKGRKPGVMDFHGVKKLNFDATDWYYADTLEEALEQIIKLEI